MLYKHWKKILLALTGFFWASCDNDPSSASDESPSSSSIEKQSSSSTTGGQESSSSAEEATSSSENTPNVTSSSSKARSSSSEMIAPKYGVMFTCERKGEKIACEDGVTCTEEVSETMQSPECTGDVCAKYGVVVVKETTYKCDDGKVYKAAEFRSKYDILDGAVDLYGCPSDICGPDTLVEAQPLYGVSNTIMRP